MSFDLSWIKKPVVRSIEEAQARYQADHPDEYCGPLDGAFVELVGQQSPVAAKYLTDTSDAPKAAPKRAAAAKTPPPRPARKAAPKRKIRPKSRGR